MRVRPISPEELDLFVEAGSSPEYRQETRDYVESMFSAGSMRPEWCFVAEENSRFLGRVAFWTIPGMKSPFALVLLDVDRDEEHTEVGQELLRDILERARGLGSQEIEHVLDEPPAKPQFQYRPAERATLLEDVGFSLRRETYRVEWTGGELPEPTGRLYFRTLEQVGKESFIAAMTEVSEGTLDGEIQAERTRLGPHDAAREFFDDARRLKHDPSWWRLAYEVSSGKLVGLVMPAEPPAFLTIFYIGVVPDMRGKGYVDDLLATATGTLLKASAESGAPLKADTDIANSPMAAAFKRAGWKRFANRRQYGLDLTTDPDGS